MYCTECGAENQSPKAYCTRCGEWLPPKGRSRKGFGGDTPQQSLSTALFMSAISTLAALFSAIALYATHLGGGAVKWSVFVAAAFCLCIAAWQTSNFFITLRLKQRLKSSREAPAKTHELNQANAPAALKAADTSAFIHAHQSVTENTTELLDPIPAQQRGRQR